MFSNIFNNNELVYVLRNIGGWHTYSRVHIENKELVDLAFNKDFISYRFHYDSIYPNEASLAFELTDKGLDFLKSLDFGLYNGACKMREWYRENTSRPIISDK